MGGRGEGGRGEEGRRVGGRQNKPKYVHCVNYVEFKGHFQSPLSANYQRQGPEGIQMCGFHWTRCI